MASHDDIDYYSAVRDWEIMISIPPNLHWSNICTLQNQLMEPYVLIVAYDTWEVIVFTLLLLVHLTHCWLLGGGGWVEGFLVIVVGTSAWASYHIRKITVAHASGMPGTFSPQPTPKETASWRSRYASQNLCHARAVIHVGIANPQGAGKTFLAHAQPAILPIWQEAIEERPPQLWMEYYLTQTLALPVHSMSRSQLYLEFGHFDSLSFTSQWHLVGLWLNCISSV